MKNFIYALIITIIVHLWFFTTIKIEQPKIISISPKSKSTYSQIKYVKLMQTKPVVEKKILEKPTIEEKPKKEIIEKKIPKKKVYKRVPKKIKKIEKKQIEPKQQTITPLESTLVSKKPNKPLDKLTKSYLRLYGKEYNNFTPNQKKFLHDNIKDIGLITKRYIRYPLIAIRTRQSGVNAVEFFLHPNGDISGLRLISKRKYTSLDKNSLYTIQIAYKDYPKPKETTKIRIYINYHLD